MTTGPLLISGLSIERCRLKNYFYEKVIFTVTWIKLREFYVLRFALLSTCIIFSYGAFDRDTIFNSVGKLYFKIGLKYKRYTIPIAQILET